MFSKISEHNIFCYGDALEAGVLILGGPFWPV